MSPLKIETKRSSVVWWIVFDKVFCVLVVVDSVLLSLTNFFVLFSSVVVMHRYRPSLSISIKSCQLNVR